MIAAKWFLLDFREAKLKCGVRQLPPDPPWPLASSLSFNRFCLDIGQKVRWNVDLPTEHSEDKIHDEE